MPEQWTQQQQPPASPVGDEQGRDGETDEQEDQRPLDQDAGGERGPEHRRQDPSCKPGLDAVFAEIGSRHRAHRREDGCEQHRVGFGEPRLDAQQHRACHHQSGQYGGAARDEGKRHPIGQQHGADCTNQRRQTIKSDRGQCAAPTERVGRNDRPGLQPIDADRLLVAGDILEPDVDIVARLDHLLGRLGKPRLIAVDRRNCELSGKKREQRRNNQHGHGAPVRGDGEVDHGLEAVGPPRKLLTAAGDCRHAVPEPGGQ